MVRCEYRIDTTVSFREIIPRCWEPARRCPRLSPQYSLMLEEPIKDCPQLQHTPVSSQARRRALSGSEVPQTHS